MVKRKMESATSTTQTHNKGAALHVISPEEEYRYWESQYESADNRLYKMNK
jgi:hypothetical protein